MLFRNRIDGLEPLNLRPGQTGAELSVPGEKSKEQAEAPTNEESPDSTEASLFSILKASDVRALIQKSQEEKWESRSGIESHITRRNILEFALSRNFALVLLKLTNKSG